MTNQSIILILKAKFKRYFEGESLMNLEIDQLLEDYREAVISDFCRKQKPTALKKQSNWKNLKKWQH